MSSNASDVPFLHPTQLAFFLDAESVIAVCEKYHSYQKSNIRNIDNDINEILKFVKPLGENYSPLLEEINKRLETPICYYP